MVPTLWIPHGVVVVGKVPSLKRSETMVRAARLIREATPLYADNRRRRSLGHDHVVRAYAGR